MWKKLLVILSVAFLTTLFFNLSLLLGIAAGASSLPDQIAFSLSLFLSLQGLFTLFWMLYYWEHPFHAVHKDNQASLIGPDFGFTALLPARHEQGVLRDTIKSLASLDYPEHLKELLILCKEDDHETIAVAEKSIQDIGLPNVRLLIFSSGPINKPHALNIGLRYASHDIVCIFDAEDQPHKSIYSVLNKSLKKTGADVIQSGVQLTNPTSKWFSVFNCLEYFFWFKSGLPFFYRLGRFAPLGGNSVFFKKDWLHRVGGWDEDCLTEDADIAVRLIASGAKLHLLYDEVFSTREETPGSTHSLVCQRTRWNHGFLQIVAKGEWVDLPGTRSRLTSLYILFSPFISLFSLLYLPFGITFGLMTKDSIVISMISFIPFYIFMGQLLTHLFGLWEFAKNYNIKVSPFIYLHLIVYYLPYQAVLAFSSLRAIAHFVKGSGAWEKTLHINAHRLAVRPA